MGGGALAEERRQRAVGVADIAGIVDIARDRKSKICHGAGGDRENSQGVGDRKAGVEVGCPRG